MKVGETLTRRDGECSKNLTPPHVMPYSHSFETVPRRRQKDSMRPAALDTTDADIIERFQPCGQRATPRANRRLPGRNALRRCALSDEMTSRGVQDAYGDWPWPSEDVASFAGEHVSRRPRPFLYSSGPRRRVRHRSLGQGLQRH